MHLYPFPRGDALFATVALGATVSIGRMSMFCIQRWLSAIMQTPLTLEVYGSSGQLTYLEGDLGDPNDVQPSEENGIRK